MAFVHFMPAADVVEVVRCKDCKDYKTQTCKMDDPYDMDYDDFCSCGDKRIPTPGTSCHPLPEERAWEE